MYHQIESAEDRTKHCFKNEWTLHVTNPFFRQSWHFIWNLPQWQLHLTFFFWKHYTNFWLGLIYLSLVTDFLQANLCQKLIFLQNMGRTVVYKNCSECQNCQNQFLYITWLELGIFMYWTCNSMNNLSSCCGLVDAKIRASDKDLPVIQGIS